MGKFLRFIGILLMGLTAALTILSGVGTTCVAIDATQYDSMKALADYQWLYIFYVLATIAIGVYGVRATISLVRGAENAYRDSLIMLGTGTLLGIVHMLTSRALRGSSMPVDAIVYTTIFTLAVFLVFSFPKISQKIRFEEGSDNGKTAAGGMSAMIAGLLFLSVQMWAGPTHIFDGVNYADAFHTKMLISGGFLIILGLGLLIYAISAKTGVSETGNQEARNAV